MGVRYLGPAKFKGEYMLLSPSVFPGIQASPYFLYLPGSSVAAEPGTQVLATYGHPYFDRGSDHFMSHRQTPMDKDSGEPLITRKANVVYIANPFFSSYAQEAYYVQKQVVRDLIRTMVPRPILVASNLPSTAIATVQEQTQDSGKRHVVHLLYYPLTRRAPNLDIIEEPGIAENIELKLRCDRRPARVSLVPQKKPLEFQYSGGYAICRVSRLEGHQAIVFE
jgi:hypothetical protein